MGLTIARILDRLWGSNPSRIIMVGLDAAGKTTILYKLKLNEMVTTIPTVGFNVETIDYKGSKITIWDVGGQDKIRILWRHYYQKCDGIIFVIDSTDKERLDTARDELRKLLAEEELKNCVLLVFANKQDRPNPVTVSEMTDYLQLSSLTPNKWNIIGSIAPDGVGLCEGLDWFITAISNNKR